MSDDHTTTNNVSIDDDIIIKSSDEYKITQLNNVIDNIRPTIIIAEDIELIEDSIIIPASSVDRWSNPVTNYTYTIDLTKYYKILPENANIQAHPIHDTDFKYGIISNSGILTINQYINNEEFNVTIRLLSNNKKRTIKCKFEKILDDSYGPLIGPARTMHTLSYINESNNSGILNNYGYGESNIKFINFYESYANTPIHPREGNRCISINESDGPAGIEIPITDDMPKNIQLQFGVHGINTTTGADNVLLSIIDDSDPNDVNIIEVHQIVAIVYDYNGGGEYPYNNPMTNYHIDITFNVVMNHNGVTYSQEDDDYSTNRFHNVEELSKIGLDGNMHNYYDIFVRLYDTGDISIFFERTDDDDSPAFRILYSSFSSRFGTIWDSNAVPIYGYDYWYNKHHAQFRIIPSTNKRMSNYTRIIIGNNANYCKSLPIVINRGSITICDILPLFEEYPEVYVPLNRWYDNNVTTIDTIYGRKGNPPKFSIKNIDGIISYMKPIGLYATKNNHNCGLHGNDNDIFYNYNKADRSIRFDIFGKFIDDDESDTVIFGLYCTNTEYIKETTVTRFEVICNNSYIYVQYTINNITYTTNKSEYDRVYDTFGFDTAIENCKAIIYITFTSNGYNVWQYNGFYADRLVIDSTTNIATAPDGSTSDLVEYKSFRYANEITVLNDIDFNNKGTAFILYSFAIIQ